MFFTNITINNGIAEPEWQHNNYIARACNPSDVFWPLEGVNLDELGNFAIVGNRYFDEHIPEHIKVVVDLLDHEELLEAFNDISTNGGTLPLYGRYYPDYKTKREAIKYLARDIEPLQNFNNYQIGKLHKILSDYRGYGLDDEATLAALSLIYGGTWKKSTIRGASQGDWQDVVYKAEEWTDKDISTFENEYFCLGLDYELDDCWYYVHDTWNDNVIKKELSDLSGIPEDKILIA